MSIQASPVKVSAPRVLLSEASRVFGMTMLDVQLEAQAATGRRARRRKSVEAFMASDEVGEVIMIEGSVDLKELEPWNTLK